MADEELSDRFFDTSVHLAEANFEAALARFRRECFRLAKWLAREVAEGRRTVDDLWMMDDFVRSVYADWPRELVEWEEIMRDFDLSQEVVDDGK